MNVRDVLLEMRRFRMGLIQTPDQLRFSYAAIIEGAKQLPLNNVVTNANIRSSTILLIDVSWLDQSNNCDDRLHFPTVLLFDPTLTCFSLIKLYDFCSFLFCF